MRFDEFVQRRGVVALPVDLFTGLVVEVGVPPGWEPFDSAEGVRVWVCRRDPCIDRFCANAVLTMHRVGAVLDATKVFDMQAEQQLQSVSAGHELRRELDEATDGDGLAGTLAIRIPHALGSIDSVSHTRLISTEQETLIAQLTVTALHESPVARANIWLTIQTGAAAGAASVSRGSGAPVAGTRDDD